MNCTRCYHLDRISQSTLGEFWCDLRDLWVNFDYCCENSKERETMFNLKLDGFESSNIKEFGYSSYYNILRTHFLNGTAYDYFNVPVKVFEDLKAAESKGKAFNALVKGAGFEFKKVVRG